MTMPLPEPTTLPVISLAKHKTLDTLAQALYDSCTKEGFMYVCDHGIPQSVIDDAFAISAAYFDANIADKKTHTVDLKDNTGYTAYRQESLDTTNSAGDLKELFHYADTEWRAANGVKQQELPGALAGSRAKLDACVGYINALGGRLLQGLAVALKLEPTFFTSQHTGELNRMRMLHYPPVPSNHTDLDPNQADIRAGAHTDYGSITILFQHLVSGLQVRRNGAWVDVPTRQGCVVINIGDALEFWSGALFKSTLHRVVMPRSEAELASRYSIAYFVHPDNDSVLDPVMDGADEAVLEDIIVSKGLPAGTRRISGGDYVQHRLKVTYAAVKDK